MPTFTIVISDSPFCARETGTAPFLETIEQGASAAISTPATEAYKRCLDAIANDQSDRKSGSILQNVADINTEWEDSFNQLYDAANALLGAVSDKIAILRGYFMASDELKKSHEISMIFGQLDAALTSARQTI